MAFEELRSPIPEFSIEDKRLIPEFAAEETRAVRRILEPTVKRPIRPMYSFVRNYTPDLAPRTVSPGTTLWGELRYLATGELNYARWADTVETEGEIHELTLHSAHGPASNPYEHRVLRCSCCLPDYRDTSDINEEYVPCAGKEAVINSRTVVFRRILGLENTGCHLHGESLRKAAEFTIGLVRTDPYAWAPTDRSDRLLLAKLADVYEVDEHEMTEVVVELGKDNVVQLHPGNYPSISIAA